MIQFTYCVNLFRAVSQKGVRAVNNPQTSLQNIDAPSLPPPSLLLYKDTGKLHQSIRDTITRRLQTDGERHVQEAPGVNVAPGFNIQPFLHLNSYTDFIPCQA